MKRNDTLAMLLLYTTLYVGLASLDVSIAAYEVAAMRLDGQVKLMKIHLCGLEPGSCAGFMVLATTAAGEVILEIAPGMRIERSKQLVTIDELKIGDYVAVQVIHMGGETPPRIMKLEITPQAHGIASGRILPRP
jgi:hypothetical protein